MLRESFQMIGNLVLYTEHSQKKEVGFRKNGSEDAELIERYSSYYDVFSSDDNHIYKEDLPKPSTQPANETWNIFATFPFTQTVFFPHRHHLVALDNSGYMIHIPANTSYTEYHNRVSYA